MLDSTKVGHKLYDRQEDLIEERGFLWGKHEEYEIVKSVNGIGHSIVPKKKSKLIRYDPWDSWINNEKLKTSAHQELVELSYKIEEFKLTKEDEDKRSNLLSNIFDIDIKVTSKESKKKKLEQIEKRKNFLDQIKKGNKEALKLEEETEKQLGILWWTGIVKFAGNNILNWVNKYGLLGIMHHYSERIHTLPIWEKGLVRPYTKNTDNLDINEKYKYHADKKYENCIRVTKNIYTFDELEVGWYKKQEHFIIDDFESSKKFKGLWYPKSTIPESSYLYKKLIGKLVDRNKIISRNDIHLFTKVNKKEKFTNDFEIVNQSRFPIYYNSDIGFRSLEDTKKNPFVNWCDYFPKIKNMKEKFIPEINSDKFWEIYGEPISSFCHHAEILKDSLEEAFEIQREKQNSQYKLFGINALRGGLILLSRRSKTDISLNSQNKIKVRHYGPSLLSNLTTMAMYDLSGERPLSYCENINCKTPIFRNKGKRKYCNDKCKFATRKRRQRKRTNSKKN